MNAHITRCLANPVWLHPIDTRRRDDVVIYLFLSHNVVPPYHDVVTRLQKRCRLKDVCTTSLYCCKNGVVITTKKQRCYIVAKTKL